MLSQTKFQNKDMAICRDMLRLILVTHDKSNNKKTQKQLLPVLPDLLLTKNKDVKAFCITHKRN